MQNIVKLDDSELEKVSGGYTLEIDLYNYETGFRQIDLCQAEYDALEKEGILKNGELHQNDIGDIRRCLFAQGFKENLRIAFTDVKSYSRQRRVIKRIKKTNPIIPIKIID